MFWGGIWGCFWGGIRGNMDMARKKKKGGQGDFKFVQYGIYPKCMLECIAIAIAMPLHCMVVACVVMHLRDPNNKIVTPKRSTFCCIWSGVENFLSSSKAAALSFLEYKHTCAMTTNNTPPPSFCSATTNCFHRH
jgi:hypothetical protein